MTGTIRDELAAALYDLFAFVQGESPHLLEDHRLFDVVSQALARHRAAKEEEPTQTLDITAPHIVSVEIRMDGTVLWVNIDGLCRLRACKIEVLEIIDARAAGEQS